MKSLNGLFKTFLAGLAACVLTVSPTVQADEWELNTPYYEDDTWYDVSEWFDGNDYNPVDESFGTLDNETYDVASDTGADQDNDANSDSYSDYDYDYGSDDSYVFDYDGDFGYGYDDAEGNDDWFYDYYDDGYGYYTDADSDGVYDFSYRYYDFDDDGIYDAYSSYSDWDGDGIYDDYNYYTFNDAAKSNDQNQSQQQQDASSHSAKAQSVSGKIVQKKQVDVRDTQHILVQLKKQDGNKCFADLGPASKLKNFDLKEGQQITVRGPMAKMGDRKLLVAQHVKANGESTQIDRQRRKVQGKVQDVRTAQVRGSKRQFVILKADGKRCLVDLGPADKLDIDVSQGDQLTVRGPMAKMQDRKLLMAQTVTHNGDQTEIDRREESQNRSSSESQARR